MKFSISFKYQNATFKNTKLKESVAYETKSTDGNTFSFDNVDEDVVIGIVKGIKEQKASMVFGYDDFRTNFINTIARNKCKELYDKMEKDGWKVEDIVVSNITLKDVEFTKPTMNAREALTIEHRNVNNKWKPICEGWDNEEQERLPIVFKKTNDDEVIAFFPDTMYDGSCNPNCLMSYMHTGQHGEASVDFYEECVPATKEEYQPLLEELREIYDDVLVYAVSPDRY